MFSNNSIKNQFSEKVTLAANAVNNSGNLAYNLQDKEALAQLVVTGTFTDDSIALQKQIIDFCNKVPAEFIAKLAIYAREKAAMKDTPALLTAILATKDSELLKKTFSRSITDPKMLRNFVSVMRSGIVGRKSLGTVSKKLVQKFLSNLTDDQLFKANIGNAPSLKDIIKLSHPCPKTPSRTALYAYLLDKVPTEQHLPDIVKEFEVFKKDLGEKIPNVPFQMLTALSLKEAHWAQIASNATWNQVRMNLNTYARHNVFSSQEMVDKISKKLQDEDQIKKSKVLPYQIFSAFMNAEGLPPKIMSALEQAAQISLANVPSYEGQVYVMVDTSGSMRSSVTGYRGGVTSKTTCVHVAALFASAILAKNPNAKIIPFDTKVHECNMSSVNTITENTAALAKFGGGGTNCSIALKHLNENNMKGNTVIFISDNEANVDPNSYASTSMMNVWNEFKKNNQDARIINIDITPRTTTQVHSRNDILNIGGFSDAVFETIEKFVSSKNKNLFVADIEAIQL